MYFGLRHRVVNGYVDRCEKINEQWQCTYVSGEQRYEVHACCLVIAAGKSTVASIPQQLQHQLRSYTGQIIHSKDIKDYTSLVHSNLGHILLIGMGNSALDIAASLIQVGTAQGRLHISARSVAPVLPRQYGILAIERIALLLSYFPPAFADKIVHTFYWYLSGSLYRSKLNDRKLSWLPYIKRKVPSIDKGTFIDSVKSGRIIIHGDIDFISDRSFMFHGNSGSGGDGGSGRDELSGVDRIILCTGYETHLDWLHEDQSHTYSSNTNDSGSGSGSNEYKDSQLDRLIRRSQAAEHWSNQSWSLHVDSGNGCYNDGLYAIGYDTGDALIPLQGICRQAIGIGKAISLKLRNKK